MVKSLNVKSVRTCRLFDGASQGVSGRAASGGCNVTLDAGPRTPASALVPRMLEPLQAPSHRAPLIPGFLLITPMSNTLLSGLLGNPCSILNLASAAWVISDLRLYWMLSA